MEDLNKLENIEKQGRRKSIFERLEEMQLMDDTMDEDEEERMRDKFIKRRETR